MKNRIYIILGLAFLFVSLSSVKAQLPGNYPDIDTLYIIESDTNTIYGKNWPEASDPKKVYDIDSIVNQEYIDISLNEAQYRLPYVFEGCNYTLRIEFDQRPHPDSALYVWFKPIQINPVEERDFGDCISLTSEKFLIPKNQSYIDVPFHINRVPDELNKKMFYCVAYINQHLTGFYGVYGFACINKFSYNVEYIPPTIKYEGLLNVNINSPSENTLYSLNNGWTWKTLTDTIKKSEIKNLQDYNVILIKEPLTCDYTEVPIESRESPIIYREILIPSVRHAILDKSPGKHYIPSGHDFTFTIQPAGGDGNTPFVHTNRTSIPDSEGVITVNNGDGTFTVTIKHVQQNIKVSIDFITGNEHINQDNNIWVYNNQLHITTASAEKANIFNATGTLIKTVPIVAGETVSLPLPRGFYIVNIQDKSYKVVSK